MTCIFCDLITPEQIIHETANFQLVFDIDPIQTGHVLLMSKAHYLSLTDLPRPLLHELIDLEADIVRVMEETLPIDGVTVAGNDKALMDEGTHFHRHLIPRRREDGFWNRIDLAKESWSLSDFRAALGQ